MDLFLMFSFQVVVQVFADTLHVLADHLVGGGFHEFAAVCDADGDFLVAVGQLR